MDLSNLWDEVAAVVAKKPELWGEDDEQEGTLPLNPKQNTLSSHHGLSSFDPRQKFKTWQARKAYMDSIGPDVALWSAEHGGALPVPGKTTYLYYVINAIFAISCVCDIYTSSSQICA
jgi:hypothetical protein